MTDRASEIDGALPAEKTSLDLAREALAGGDPVEQSAAVAAIAEDIIGGRFAVYGMGGCEKLIPAFCVTLTEICKRGEGRWFPVALKDMVVSASRVMRKFNGDKGLSDLLLELIGKLEIPEERLTALMSFAPQVFAGGSFEDREKQKIGADLIKALCNEAGCFEAQIDPALRARAAFTAFCGTVRFCGEDGEEFQRAAVDIITKTEDGLRSVSGQEQEMFVGFYREIAANAKIPEVAELAANRWVSHLKTLDPVCVQEMVDKILFVAGDKYSLLVRACFKESKPEARERRPLPTREAIVDFMKAIVPGFEFIGDGPV